MSKNDGWKSITVKDGENVWVDFRLGHYVIAQGFAEEEMAWSLFHKGEWVADFKKISDAKAKANQMEGES